jgi:serine phosphatase RsbU (regulator of sigma subunit)
MNQFLCQSNRLYTEGINTEGSDAPVCLALAVIERQTGKGTLAIAGMEPPILVRTGGDTEQSEAIGMPLGVAANEVYKQIDFQLEAGDTLVMTTDGITEARQGRKFLNAEGLIRLALEGNGGTLKEMADTILSGAKEFAGGKLKDDAALLLVRRADTSPDLGERPPGP